MNELTIINIVLAILALGCLIAGLTYQLHKNHTLFLFSGCAAISGVINPIFFLNNDDMYAYQGWSAIKIFDFSIEALLKSYESFYFIFSTIVILSLIVIYAQGGGGQEKRPIVASEHEVAKRNYGLEGNYRLLLIFCIALSAIYFPLYEWGVGITGVPGELPFHLSGMVHYIRAYLVPIALAIFIYRSPPTWKLLAIVCLYAMVAGISAASRFVGILPMVLATFYLVTSKKHGLAATGMLFSALLWFVISASRDVTFDGDRHALLTTIYYSITNIRIENIVNELDLFSGRFSGAQQMVLVSQLRGNNECSDLFGFLLGVSDICTDTAGVVFGLDLSGTAYGVGLALIPSIIISGDGIIDYMLPAVYVVCMLWMNQFFYHKLSKKFNWHGVAIFYLLLSVLFVYLGQLRLYYILQFALSILLISGPWILKYFLLQPFKNLKAELNLRNKP